MRISFCTSCMNRLFHLKETYLKNIKENEDCKDLEFALLDYSSPDGLDDWVKENCKDLIARGRVVYWRANGYQHFAPSHARNVSMLLGSGDIVCNLDADNFIDTGVATDILKIFTAQARSITQPLWTRDYGIAGFIALRKDDFLRLRGYDESFVGYGYEDIDLRERAVKMGLKPVGVGKYMHSIQHGPDERLKNIDWKKTVWDSNGINMHKSANRVPGEIINRRGYGVAAVSRNFSGVYVRIGQPAVT